jgi:hypothetical protein
MAARLTVIFFIVLCMEAGIALTLLPWISPFGISDWGDNYLLVYAADKANLPALRTAVSSGWVRGAVTGLGVLNLIIAFWELANFSSAVRALEGKTDAKTANKNSARLPHHRRNDERR